MHTQSSLHSGDGGDSSGKMQHGSKHSVKQHRMLEWEHQIPGPDFSYTTASMIVSFFAVICFMDSIHGDFVFDDSEAILNNHDVRWDAPLRPLFSHDFWGTRLTHPSSHKSYRPLTVLSFRLNHVVSGLSPRSYHCVNVFLHCLVSVASLRVFACLLRGSRSGALLAALLFTTHPIHTEAVAGIVGRADLLCALFVFAALLAYVRAVHEDTHSTWLQASAAAHSCDSTSVRKGRVSAQAHQMSVGQVEDCCGGYKWLVVCAMSTTVAMLCKEVGITALGLCSAYELLATGCEEPGGGLLCHLPFGKHRRHCMRRTKVRCVLSRHAMLLVVGCGLLIGRWLIMGSAVPRFMDVDNPASFMSSAVLRGLNYQYVYLLNVILLVAPVWLCFDWSMGCVPLIEGWNDVRLVAVAGLWVVAVLLVKRGVTGTGRTSSCVLLSLAMATVPFLPATNLFFRVGFVVAERVLYLPLAGMCCLVVLGMRELAAHCWLSKRVLLLWYALLVCVFVLRCRQRTTDWLTEKQLFKSALKVCPLNAKVHYNLGKVAGDAGSLEEAVSRYREALRLNPQYDQAMNNLANILKDEGSLSEALELLQRATELRPDFAAAWMNLGIVQASLGQLESSQRSYTAALQHRPVYPDCLYNLGNLYLERGDAIAALKAWHNATSIKPSLARAWINTLILLDSRENYDTAVEVAHTALKHLPNESSLHFNLANTLGKLSRYQDSETHFLHATRLDPSNANYWSNLGVLYHRWKKYPEAEAAYKHTLRLNRNLKSAQDNLNMLLKAVRGTNR